MGCPPLPNRARARYRPRYRALAVDGERWRRGGGTEVKESQRREAFAVSPGIDNEHDNENENDGGD